MKKLVCLAVLALSTVFVPAALADAAIVNVFSGCDGGTRIVPAGSSVEPRLGWIAKTRGLVTEYEQAETTVLAIDGVRRLDTDDPAWRSIRPSRTGAAGG